MGSTEYPYRKKGTYAGIPYDIKARTEEDLGIKYARRIDAIKKGTLTSGGSTPVNKWAEKYFDSYVSEKVSNGVLEDRKSMYRNHIAPYIGVMKIKDVNSGHCQKVANNMKGYSGDRIDKCCQLMYNMFKKAKSEKLIYENPADDIVRPDGEDKKGRPATMQERAFMLMVGKNHKAGLWLRTILYCGFRPGETDTFKGGHINYDAGLIYIDGTKSDAAKRIVPAPAHLLADLKALNRKPNEYIFQNAYGDRMRKSSRAKLWNSFKNEMNIRAGCKIYRNQVQEPFAIADDLIPYCFRHSFATDLKDARIPFRIRQELLGHAGSSVTDGYTHRTETSLKIAAALLDKFRAEQEAEVIAEQKKILELGYKREEKITEDLTHKFFPDLL